MKRGIKKLVFCLIVVFLLALSVAAFFWHWAAWTLLGIIATGFALLAAWLKEIVLPAFFKAMESSDFLTKNE